MSDTFTKTCNICEQDFDGINNGQSCCDECLEKDEEIDPMTLAKDRAVDESI